MSLDDMIFKRASVEACDVTSSIFIYCIISENRGRECHQGSLSVTVPPSVCARAFVWACVCVCELDTVDDCRHVSP
jgi:hypothetical protein